MKKRDPSNERAAHSTLYASAPRQPGFANTSAGREVYDTGKVVIGIRAGERPPQRELSRSSGRLQRALGVRFGEAAGNSMHPLNWRTFGQFIDDQIAANRSRFDETVLRDDETSLRMAPLRRPSLIPLDGSLLGRFARWIRNLSLKGPTL
jgi:hypothetical protein